MYAYSLVVPLVVPFWLDIISVVIKILGKQKFTNINMLLNYIPQIWNLFICEKLWIHSAWTVEYKLIVCSWKEKYILYQTKRFDLMTFITFQQLNCWGCQQKRKDGWYSLWSRLNFSFKTWALVIYPRI